MPKELMLRYGRALAARPVARGKAQGNQQAERTEDRDQQGALEASCPPEHRRKSGIGLESDHDAGQPGNDDEPVEEQVAEIKREGRPEVRRGKPDLRRQVVAVFAQPSDRRRFRVGSAGTTGECRPHGRETSALYPKREPASDIAAAGNGREVVKTGEQRRRRLIWRRALGRTGMIGQRLDDAQGEGSAPDAAARQAERKLVQPVQSLVERLRFVRCPRFVRLLRIVLRDAMNCGGLLLQGILGRGFSRFHGVRRRCHDDLRCWRRAPSGLACGRPTAGVGRI